MDTVLNKDPDEYQTYTPQHKIGTSMNKEAGSLIKYYKTGLEEDGYRGYSTNYQDLNVDVYKEELWRIVKDILTLQGYDIQKLEDRIFEVEDDIAYGTNPRLTERQQIKHKRSQSNIQLNKSLAKYFISLQILITSDHSIKKSQYKKVAYSKKYLMPIITHMRPWSQKI